MGTVDGATWRTTSYSGTNGNCVEVADAGGTVKVRDTQDRAGADHIYRSRAESRNFGARVWSHPMPIESGMDLGYIKLGCNSRCHHR